MSMTEEKCESVSPLATLLFVYYTLQVALNPFQWQDSNDGWAHHEERSDSVSCWPLAERQITSGYNSETQELEKKGRLKGKTEGFPLSCFAWSDLQESINPSDQIPQTLIL